MYVVSLLARVSVLQKW